jgi:hypothetical protein
MCTAGGKFDRCSKPRNTTADYNEISFERHQVESNKLLAKTAEDIPAEVLKSDDTRKSVPPLYGALLKNEQDVHLFEQLVFLDRRSRTQ